MTSLANISQVEKGLEPWQKGLQMLNRPLDNTALSAYLACPREFLFSMVMHRRSGGKSAALTFGSGWHHALEAHYKSGGDREVVHYFVRKKWEDHGSPDDHRTLERVLLDYDKYLKKYDGRDGNDVGATVGFPENPLVEIATNAQGDALVHPWAVKIDRIVKIGGLYYAEDHKTTSRLDRNYFKQFELSYQMMGYTYVAQQLFPDIKIQGVRINLSHVLKDKSEFYRELFPYSPAQIKVWTATTNAWLRQLGDATYRYYSALESGGDPYNAIVEAFPAHFGDNGCSRKFGLCQYHPVCSAGPAIQLRLLEREYDVVPWNPLEVDDD